MLGCMHHPTSICASLSLPRKHEEMNMRTSPVHVIVTVIVLALSSLACNIALPSAPAAPIPTFVPSPKDASDMEQSFRNAVNQASTSGNFNVSVTQQQLSSYLALNGPALAARTG